MDATAGGRPDQRLERSLSMWRRRAGLVATGIGVVVLIAAYAIGGRSLVDQVVGAIRAAARGGEGHAPALTVYLLAAGFTFVTGLTPLPAEAAALLNGTLFPPATAFVLTWTASLLGAAASYELGRWAGRSPARRLFGAERLARVERLVERAGWPALLALRLSPVMAFTALNWASGILALSRPVFYWTVALGLVPGTYVFSAVPELLESGGSAARLAGAAIAVMAGLLAVAYRRSRRVARGS